MARWHNGQSKTVKQVYTVTMPVCSISYVMPNESGIEYRLCQAFLSILGKFLFTTLKTDIALFADLAH